MTTSDTSKLGHANAAFGLAAAVTVLFNAVLACIKDAYAPLKAHMTALTGQDWTTQGLTDVILFVALGLVFTKSTLPEKISSNRLVTFLVAAVVVAGLGLVVWYALF
jgi:hypothetical protein